jgi:hypothetical protein
MSVLHGRYLTVQYLLEEADANMDDSNFDGNTVWDMLRRHLEEAVAYSGEGADPLALTGLLRVLVLRGAPPPAVVALLSPEPARVVQEGAQLRARLPAYLVRRRALLDAHCPVLLPPLRALVHSYMELTTTEELWALPAYLVRRRALVDAHCPALLPPLRALVHGYMELTTTEELWATELGTAL